MLLHVINKSPFERNALESCLRTAADGAAILMIEDGVYGALDGTAVSGRVREAMARLRVYVLKPDLEARGMAGKAMAGIEQVDYAGFVELAASHDAVQSWL